MRYKKILTAIIFFLTIYGCKASGLIGSDGKDFTKYVDPLIGTAKTTTISGSKHGRGTEQNAQVQPAVTVPFAMTNWTPQTQNTEKKCIAAYYYYDSVITGFRGSHWLSGSCSQDYGSMTVMPVSGSLVCSASKRGSKFSHSKEISAPNYYSVKLDDYDIDAEMTATTRCGILRFTFEKEGDAHIILTPNNDKSEGFVQIIPEKNEVTGYNPVRRLYQGWGKKAGFSGYFVARIEKVINSFGVYSDDRIFDGQTNIENNPGVGAFLSFKVSKGEQVIVKVGTSFVSIEQARKNLDSEIPAYNFDAVKENLKSTWNNLLSRIEVEGDNKDDIIKFYTAMYHCYQQPRIYNDVDGLYPRFNGNAQTDTMKDGNYYCDFSLWDTFRALHPLYNILTPKQNAEIVKSLLIMAKAGGWMPIFPLWNSYTSEMIGDHAIAVIAEAYIKGALKLNEEEYNILKHNADELPASFEEYKDGKGRRALSSYLKYGYIPMEDSVKESFHDNEQVSRTLEYAYDDFALACISKKMGKDSDYAYFLKRSQNYKNVFDVNVKNVNDRHIDGTFAKDFARDKECVYITEGTPWQYNWFVPHDINGLIAEMGGKDTFNNELDSFFKAGQYWHGNEPSHQIAYLYNYSGQPWKTQKLVADILKEEYDIGPGGLSGNDDSGQMSAWYILGAIGFYPVCPVLPEYQICGPKFNKIKIKLDNGRIFLITAPNYSTENIYIRGIELNGKKFEGLSLPHEIMMQGGQLNFELSNKPMN
jgi:predicted alpha-1,2-mannosidase